MRVGTTKNSAVELAWNSYIIGECAITRSQALAFPWGKGLANPFGRCLLL